MLGRDTLKEPIRISKGRHPGVVFNQHSTWLFRDGARGYHAGCTGGSTKELWELLVPRPDPGESALTPLGGPEGLAFPSAAGDSHMR